MLSGYQHTPRFWRSVMVLAAIFSWYCLRSSPRSIDSKLSKCSTVCFDRLKLYFLGYHYQTIRIVFIKSFELIAAKELNNFKTPFKKHFEIF